MRRPFSIESFPVLDAHWTVVPAKSGDEVLVCLDLGGGEGPVVARAEWIPSSLGGFLAWHVNDEDFVEDPRWVKGALLEAVREMALDIHEQHEAERRKEGGTWT